ncbi:hypothetical protein [Rhodococcus qingshengii]|uniref:hypothetical protein n=1 Tax=Rhodococcus qingshengii TaxID=334542 RepID=UPI00237D2105|nr:hypothetical protein [Rhodococcus qingshengii]WCT05801.1 hypothetical protein PI247_30470 [Rhodococcus qingshengii]
MKAARRFDRTSPTTVISTVVVLAAMVIALLALLIFAPTSSAGPAEDCAAVRARDHQIYLNLIASLPPGAPIPPEYINPCLSAPSTTATAAPTTTVGLPGAQAPGGGPNVGANAPTNFPTYNGTPIVPVPGAALPGQPNTPTPPGIENPARVPVPTTTSGPAPTTPQPAGSTAPTSTTDRGPGPVPASTPSNAPTQSESAPAVATSGLDEDDGRDRYLELVVVGAAAFTAGGIGVRGRRSPFGPRIPLNGRTPESILSQTVGTLASPLMAYAKGGQSKITVTEPDGGRRTFFLIHDATSSHEAEIPVDVPPGGHMHVNPDGSVTVFDADGNPVSVVAAPWAYDANGTPIPTHYEIRDGQLVQVVDTAGIENLLYPILADPELTPEERAALEAQANFIGPMTPEGEQARRDAQNILAANPVESSPSPTTADPGGIDPLGNLDMDRPAEPAPTTPLPFDVYGSPTDSGTDPTAGAASEPAWNPLDNLDMDTETQPDPPMELPFGIFDSDPNNGMISPTQSGHDVPDFSPDTDGAVTAGMLSAAEEAAERAAADIGNPGRHSARAAEAIAASRSLVRLASRLPAVGVAVSVIDSALTIRGGGAIPETVGATTGGIGGGLLGAMGGARVAQALGGGPISIVVGAGVGGFGGALSGSGVGHLLGRGARALWGGNK